MWNIETDRDHQKLQPLVGEISWAKHLVVMAKCKDDLEREFYIRMTKKFGWMKNVLIHQIECQSYQATWLGQTNFDRALTPKLRTQAMKDEYTFDFLELGEQHSERELERALNAASNTSGARWMVCSPSSAASSDWWSMTRNTFRTCRCFTVGCVAWWRSLLTPTRLSI